MGDMLRILNRYMLISFVVFLLRFVLVTDLMKKKIKNIRCLYGTDLRSFRFDLSIPQVTWHVSVVEIQKRQTKTVLLCVCFKS